MCWKVSSSAESGEDGAGEDGVCPGLTLSCYWRCVQTQSIVHELR
jgi:hypothetical protein